MAAPLRRTEYTLRDQVLAQPYDFEFHQAVQLIEQMTPGCVPLGEGSDPKREAIAVKAHLTLAVPRSEIERIEPAFSQIRVYVNFVSIGGRQGPLPESFTETLLERARHKDFGFRNFLDIFNHRLASIWYRLRKKLLVGFDQLPSEKSPMGFAIKSLGGIVSPAILNNTLLQENLFIATQRLTWPHVHSREGLRRLLESFFKTKVNVQEFIGGWNKAQPEDLSHIGNKKGQYNCLGSNLIIGKKSWQQNKAIKITLGPVGWDAYQPFTTLSTNKHINLLRDITHAYVGFNTKVEVVIKLNPQDVQFVKLGQNFELGRTTWLYCDKKETLKPFCKITLKQPFTGTKN